MMPAIIHAAMLILSVGQGNPEVACGLSLSVQKPRSIAPSAPPHPMQKRQKMLIAPPDLGGWQGFDAVDARPSV
jgi:hypothetical protein